MQQDQSYVPLIGKSYLHQDGGLYTVISTTVRDTTTGEPGVLYSHYWPFEAATWFRPGAEWTHTRFKELSTEEANEIYNRDPAQGRAEVTARKAARKAAK